MGKKNCLETENNYAYHAIELLAHALNVTDEELERVNQSLKEFTYASSNITAIILRKLRSLTMVVKICICAIFSYVCHNKRFFFNNLLFNFFQGNIKQNAKLWIEQMQSKFITVLKIFVFFMQTLCISETKNFY